MEHQIIEDVFDAPPNNIRQHHNPSFGMNREQDSRNYAHQSQLQMRETMTSKYEPQPQTTPIQNLPMTISYQPQPMVIQDQSQHPEHQDRKEQYHSQYTQKIHCRDSFDHILNCDICKSYIDRDTKLYWMIIIVLLIVIACLSRKYI